MKTRFSILAVVTTCLLLALTFSCKKEVPKVIPTLTTTAISSITSTTATGGGSITNDCGATVTARGVCWSLNQSPTTSDSKTSDGAGIGSYASSITGLSPGVTYYARAYATNAVGTAYGNQVTITTLSILPTITTTVLSAVTSTTATGGGNITKDGGSAVTARGVCWSSSQNPTISNSKTTDGTGSGVFTSSITCLVPGTPYYVRAYATNSVGTAYGEQVLSTTAAIIPTLTTSDLLGISSTSATGGGNITSDGGAAVIARGVCWSTNQNPTIANSKTENGMGTGIFSSSITGLTPGTTYYLRAYATNSIGPGYGNQLSFTTSAIIPTLTTAAITDIAATSATSGGSIISDGGATITSRGVCWGANQTPTITNSKTIETSGLSIFTSTILGLSPSTTYYVRAYATNSVGTGYGTAISFASLNVETLRYCFEAYPGVKGEIVTTTLFGTTVTCERKNGLDIFQGDIILSPTTKGAGINQQNYMWPDGIVYYTINADFPRRDRITEGFKRFDKTNITFKERNNETNYVEFIYIKDAGTFSQGYGMMGGKQSIVIDNWGQPGDVAHEIGHAIGLLHEQSKAGSDDYVTIIEANIIKGKEHNFTIFTNSMNTSGFDFNSLMLYDSYAFSIQSGVLPTIVVKSTGNPYPTPQREQFTESDISMINQLYPSYPKVTTTAVSSKTTTTAICGGNVTSNGGSDISERGIYWSTSILIPYMYKKVVEGTDIGNFTSTLTGLTPNTIYYYQAYAKNAYGTGYGDALSFTTEQISITIPTVTTTPVTIYNSTSATVGGAITGDGGIPILEDGVYWSTNPLIDGTKFPIWNGTMVYSASLTGLSPNTKYYIKAYAINTQGTGYGDQLNFTTGVVPVVAFTATPTTITAGQSVQFTDQSTNATSWRWTFGDGASLSTQNPSHTYVSAGTYTVALTATNSYGSNTLTKTNYITVNIAGSAPVAAFTATPTTITAGQSVQFTDQSTNTPTSWSWNFGDGASLSTQNPSHTYVSAGTYTVSLIATNSNGSNTLTKTNYITVNSAASTVTDIDGNVYNTVTIGTQVWMAENLKTTKYRNGDIIPNVTDDTQWGNVSSTGAYCNYNNDASIANTYGRLYNWYTATDSRNIAPVGWHVPSYDDWIILRSFLDISIAGGKLKEAGIEHWISPNTGATNESGFKGLPGGVRGISAFSGLGTSGYWWSTTESNTWPPAYSFTLTNSSVFFPSYTRSMLWGMSLRCLRDN